MVTTSKTTTTKTYKRRPRRSNNKTRKNRKSQQALVKKNAKDIRQLKSVGFQYAPFQLTEATTLSTAIHVQLLTACNNWGGIFRMHGVSDADLPRQYQLKTVNVNWTAQCESDAVGNLWLQVMVVSLKTKMAAQVIARTTRLSNMSSGLDYTSQSAGTTFALQGSFGYKLNPDFYTVHYNSGQRRIGEATMAIPATEVTNINNGTTSGSCTVKFPRVFKNDVTADEGFKGLSYDQLEPRQQLYLIVFSNTSGSIVTGGELFWSMRAQFNGHCNNPN